MPAWVILLLLVVAPSAGAIESAPEPDRVPRPYLAAEPWEGFWPVVGERDPRLPMDAATQFARWEALRLSLSEPGARAAVEPPTPVLAEGVGRRTGAGASEALSRESADVRAAWATAVARARAGDAAGCRAALAGISPATLEGERAARRLLFAAAVAEGDRAAADSIFYRMGGEGDPRHATRLETWLELQEGSFARAERVLSTAGARSGGEEAALALARWGARPDEPVTDLPSWSGAEGLARAVLALVAARNSAQAGDAGSAREALGAIPAGTLPPAWGASAGEIESALGGGTEPTTDAASVAYRDAAQRFVGRRDAEAEDLLDRWLTEWPDSPLRPGAYLLRAQLRLAAGQTDAASGDILAAERQAPPGEMADRAGLLRAFLQAQLGGHADARETFERAGRGELGRKAEGELGFDRTRLQRLAGGKAEAEETILRLEEAFPDEPWASRARNDQDPSRWREPWRSLPPEPTLLVRISPPETGPWQTLLWGEDFLAREADVLEGALPSPVLADLEPTPTEPAPLPAPPSVSPVPLAFVDLGVGVPGAALLGGGVAGLYRGLHYRADLAKTLAQERSHLPDYRRTDWEAGLAVSPGNWKLGAVAEGTARTDAHAPSLGLSPDPIEASWWGVRGDILGGDPERAGFGASLARVEGEVDARSEGLWRTEQTWYGLRGAITLDGVAWTGQTTWGDLRLRNPDATRDREWFRDLRLTRSLSGGWYAGIRGSLYRNVGLLLPVAGVERPLGGSGWTAWAATEPSLRVPSFRETYVAEGDWNVPDLTLDAERRWFDLRGGLRWKGGSGNSLGAGTEVFNTTNLRTWQRQGPLWVETGLHGASGLKLIFSGALKAGGFRVAAKTEAKSVRAAGSRVPYVPRYEGWVTLDYTVQGWRFGTTLSGVGGREDETGTGYGDYGRIDLEGAYRFRTDRLPLGFRTMEASLRIENVTDAKDRRWPGVPAYGIGVMAGVRALYGSRGDE